MMISSMNFRPQEVKQIEKNEIGSYLEEAEAFYKRVDKRRKKSLEKKNMLYIFMLYNIYQRM